MDARDSLPLKFGRLDGPVIETSARKAIALPTASGFLFFSLVLLLLLGAVNFQSNLGFLMAFSLLILGFVALLFVGQNFHGIRLRAASDVFAAEGQDASLSIEMTSDFEKQKIQLASSVSQTVIDCGASLQVIELPVGTDRRGVREVCPIELGSLFPFGWAILKTRWYPRVRMVVYPEPKKPSQQLGAKSAQGLHELAVREYRTGDRMASISWKKTKSLSSPVVIDPKGRTTAHRVTYRTYASVSFELMLSYLTWEVLEAYDSGGRWSLELPGVTVPESAGRRHLDESLRALADA